ncbi:hypothetical protein ACH5RR_025051 [Cinchona calisaya]|uniref:Strictosidine synthase conserved region domain-containing protein n=1 Tax=Cinchona calisaya TaxID=153742 RepID=A0ABD2Z128_9GENT
MLCIFGMLFFLPHILAFEFDPYHKFTKLNLPPGGPIGPESVALDRFNKGPYVGVSDGRILKYQPKVGFVEFAYTAPNRNKTLCDGVSDINLGPICGRIFGISFDSVTGDLYLADTFHGLFVVGPKGGQATLIANSAGGVRFNFLSGVDVNPITREVYFTDASQTFDLRNVIRGNVVPDSSGRLIKYNPTTKEVKVVLDGLPNPVGPANSHNGTFLLYSENSNKRITKYWLQGLKAHTSEVILNLPGNPAKIKRAPKFGEFWVAAKIIVQHPPSVTPFGYKFNSLGKVLIRKALRRQYSKNTIVNVLQEYNVNGGTLFVGSREASYAGKFTKW